MALADPAWPSPGEDTGPRFYAFQKPARASPTSNWALMRPSDTPPPLRQDLQPADEMCRSSTPQHEERFMHDFVQQHLVSILRPLNEHVRELQEQVYHLIEDVRDQASMMNNHRLTLERHDNEHLDGLTKGAKMRAELSTIRSQEDVISTNIASLTSLIESTKYALADTNTRQESISSAMQTMKEKVSSLEGQFRDTKMGTWTLESKLEDTGKGLAQVKLEHETLASAHTHSEKELMCLKLEADELGTKVRCLEDFQQHLKDDHHKQVTKIAGDIVQLEHIVTEQKRDLSKKSDSVLAAHKEIGHLKQTLNMAAGSSGRIEDLKMKQDTLMESVATNSRHIATVQEGFQTLKESAAFDHLKTIELHTEVRNQLGDASSTVESLVQTRSTHAEKINRATDMLLEHQHLQKKLEDLTRATRDEVSGLIRWQQVRSADVAQHQLDGERLQSEVLRMRKDLDTTVNSYVELRRDHAVTNANLAKLGSQYRVVSKSLEGLNRGLHDTFKTVIDGDSGLLSPRAPVLRALPHLGSLRRGHEASDRGELTDRSDRADRGGRTDRYDKTERSGRGDRGDTSDRGIRDFAMSSPDVGAGGVGSRRPASRAAELAPLSATN